MLRVEGEGNRSSAASLTASVVDRPSIALRLRKRQSRAYDSRTWPTRTWSIGELAAEFDTTLRTIRFYEDRGLLAPERAGTARIFHDRDRVRLQLILRGKRLGFTLTEIAHVLNLYDETARGDAVSWSI